MADEVKLPENVERLFVSLVNAHCGCDVMRGYTCDIHVEVRDLRRAIAAALADRPNWEGAAIVNANSAGKAWDEVARLERLLEKARARIHSDICSERRCVSECAQIDALEGKR